MSSNLAWSACELLEQSRKAPHGNRSLSLYWAQEYTGADLVRAELIKNNFILPANLIDVWDAKPRARNNHGERVSQLIAGPHATALLPSDKPIQYKDVEHERGLMNPEDKFKKLYRKCSLSRNCPEFINNSMSWLKDSGIKNIISKMARNKILFITSAGNSRGLVERGKRELAARNEIVVVGNTNVFGFPAKLTDSAPEVTISAPSDGSLTTYDYQGNLKNFSGTSGSAPQVLASLANFRIVTGIAVDGSLAKILLQKTALKILPQPNNIGAGSLNAYKIYELAKRVKARCPQKSRICAMRVINQNDSMVTRKEERAVLRKLRKAFPSCADGSTYDHLGSGPSCRRKRQAFTNLRKIALLKVEDPKLWEILSCITANEGLGSNAQFYKNLKKHVSKSNDSKISEYYRYNTDADLIKYTLSHPDWVKSPEHALRVIKRAKADWTVENYLLTKTKWNHFFLDFMQENGAALDELTCSNIREIL